jgi:hypothetical protein
MRNISVSFAFVFFYACIFGQNSVGLLSFDKDRTYDGYNLIYPHNQSTVYLLDLCGRIVHRWDDESDLRPGNAAYILESGNLLKTKRPSSFMGDAIWAGGGGATVEIRSWENDLISSFTLNNDTMRLHHDAVITKEGTVLMIAWEWKSHEEAIQAGRDSSKLENSMLWPDFILEWDPRLDSIVWEWHVWDHLIQDFDASASNFGIVEDHPELVDINYDEHDGHQDWLHSNSLDYNPELDQIMLSVPYFNEFWIIDHSTTTDEAASHSGGRSGKGGDLLYRWGNPTTYQQGGDDEKKLFFQHSVKWIDPEASESDIFYGAISVFNNRVAQNISTANIIQPQIFEDGTYELSDGRFLPEDFTKTFKHPEEPEMAASGGLSSAQLLPNGNMLMLAGRWGYAYELTQDNELTWEYRVPLIAGQPVSQGEVLTITQNITFRMDRYPPDYAGFENRDLGAGDYLELNPNINYCDQLTTSTRDDFYHIDIQIYPNPFRNLLHIDLEEANGESEVHIYDHLGRLTWSENKVKNTLKIDTNSWMPGVYFMTVNGSVAGKFVK